MNDYAEGFGPRRRDDVREGDALAALGRCWPVLVVAVLVCAALGWELGGLNASAYTSSVEVVLEPLPGEPLSATSRSPTQLTSAMDSEAEMARSGPVALAVSRTLGMDPRAAAGAIDARVVSNTADLVIEFTGSTPALARRGARVTAETFLHLRANAVQRRIAADARLAAAQLAAADRRLARAPTLRSQVIRYASQVQEFAPAVGELRAVEVEPGRVITAPSTPASADARRSQRYGLGGGIAGLLLATCGVLWRSRHDRRVCGADLASIGGCPVLAVLPAAPRLDEAAGANAYRLLRTALLGRPGRVIAVSAVPPGTEGTARVVAELAGSLSGGAARVARLDAKEIGPSAGPSARAQLRELADTHDLVLAAGPPADSPDFEAFALAAGRVLLTVQDGVTPRHRCAEVIAGLRRRAVTVSGVLVLAREAEEA